MSTPATTLPPNTGEVQREIVLHPKQFEAFNFTTQYAAAISGVRGGKTFLGAVWAGKKIQETKGHGLIVGPSYKILEQSTLPTFFQVFPEWRRFYKEQKKVLQFGERNIYVRSMDEPFSAEGITADWAWGDEAGLYSLLAWTVLRSRTSLVKGQIMLTTTPYNMGWLYQDFYKRWEEKVDPALSVYSWASVDNPYFPKDFYLEEQKRLRPEEFARRYMGKFTRMAGLVYEVHPWHLLEAEKVPQRVDMVLGGVDWGYTHPAALAVAKIVNGAVYVVDEWYETGKTTPQIIDQMKYLQEKWGVRRWHADSANPEKIAEAGTGTGLNVVPYQKGPDSITYGVGVIQTLLLENRFFVAKHLKHLLSEFETYHYPAAEDGGKVKKDEPVAKDNHLCDALRYLIVPNLLARKAIVVRQSTATTIANLLASQGGRPKPDTSLL